MSTDLMRQPQGHTPATPTALAVLGLFLFVLTVGCTAGPNQDARLAPPPDYQPVAEIDLSTWPYAGVTLGQFTLEDTAMTGIFYMIQDIDTPYFDPSLIGPDGDSLVILHSEDFRTDRNGGGLWEHSLPPGTYRLALTAHQSPGLLSVYWGYD